MTTRASEPSPMSRRSRVGILGGGQLARMMALAGLPLGLQFKVLDPAADACAGECAPLVNAAFDDAAALEALAGEVDVVTFDFENVPADSARALAGKVPVHPSPEALAVAQDRLAEKTLFRELDIPVPAFAAVESREALQRALDEVGVPCILKTRRLGYDGKGQFRIRSRADADAAWDALGAQAPRVGLILEAFVPFDGEVSVVAVRGRHGEFRAWPLTANWHVDGVLSASLAPAPVSDALHATALDYARRLAGRLEYVGVFALELFRRGDALLANEMAPRVHNSGHWTIEGAETSQFENHLRAVLGLPLGSTAMRGHACMLNWIGQTPPAGAVLEQPGGHWHDYGKEPRAGRKVGHATFRADAPGSLADALDHAAGALERQDQVRPVLAVLRGG